MHLTLYLLAKFTAALRFRERPHARRMRKADSLTPWPPQPISSTREFPFARPTRRSGTPSATAWTKGCELNALTLDELKQFGAEFEQDFYAAITLEATLDCHDVIGGTARHRVGEALRDAETRVQQLIDRYGGIDVGATESTHASA